MKMEYFDFKSCFYCGIDFINAFKNVEDYQDKHDFLNNADISELQLLHGIGEKRAKTILAKRKRHDYSIEKKIKFSKRAEEQLDSLNFSNTHNHFTLDHIFPQSKYPYYSLCLYNLVPSCYSCNAKFKKSKDFTVNKELVKISPSSDKYSFDKDFEFSIYYPKELKDIKKVDDFRVENKIIGNEVQVSRYLEIFKLKGRYVFHKREVLQLIKRKVEYPDSKIKIKSRDLGLSTDEMKEILFGKELFDPLITDKPFLKLKRDIAKQIGIKGVVSH